MLDRHKRLVHTKPEDREPPRKRGRPSRPDKSQSPQVSVTTSPHDERSPSKPLPDAQTLDLHPPDDNALLTFNDFDSVDPFAEFNFAGDELLSFLKPTEDNAGVVDFASWLHMREMSSSPSSYVVDSAPLIEPGESEEMFTHQEKPKSSVAIDDELYAQLKERLRTEYNVYPVLN